MADLDSSKSPAFQFYPKDFLTDEHVALMSLQERGAYITLLCKCWIEGSLPSDVSKLARLCGVPTPAFRKFWPAILPCFFLARRGSDRLINLRLEKERTKQAEWHGGQSERGKRGAAARWRKHSGAIASPSPSNGAPPLANDASSVFSLLSSSSSADSSQVPAAANARSKRPIFSGSRLTVFEWQLDDLRKLLGSHTEAFDLHAWFFDLDAKAGAAALVIPQRDGGKWLQEQTLAEAMRRGLPIAASAAAPVGKTAGNAAAAARFIARGKA